MKKGIGSLEGIDEREHIILAAILQFQLGNNKGMSWGELLDLRSIQNAMSRQTFSRRLKGLLERGLLEREVVKNRRGKPTLYSINSKLFAELREFSVVSPEREKEKITEFARDIELLDTEQYVEAMMELALVHLYMWPIASAALRQDGARWLYFEMNYQIFEQILRYIQERASKDNAEKVRALSKMFSFLEPFASRPIGKRFGLNELFNLRKEIIKDVFDKE